MVHRVGSPFRGSGLLKMFQLLQQLVTEALFKHGEAIDSCYMGGGDTSKYVLSYIRIQYGCDLKTINWYIIVTDLPLFLTKAEMFGSSWIKIINHKF